VLQSVAACCRVYQLSKTVCMCACTSVYVLQCVVECTGLRV